MVDLRFLGAPSTVLGTGLASTRLVCLLGCKLVRESCRLVVSIWYLVKKSVVVLGIVWPEN